MLISWRRTFNWRGKYLKFWPFASVFILNWTTWRTSSTRLISPNVLSLLEPLFVCHQRKTLVTFLDYFKSLSPNKQICAFPRNHSLVPDQFYEKSFHSVKPVSLVLSDNQTAEEQMVQNNAYMKNTQPKSSMYSTPNLKCLFGCAQRKPFVC